MAKFILGHEAWGPGMYMFQCPGCECCHYVRTEKDPELPSKVVWAWNGDVDKPTVHPSLHVFERVDGKDKTTCHSFIKGGNIQFLNDCAHILKGKTVPIPDWEDDVEE